MSFRDLPRSSLLNRTPLLVGALLLAAITRPALAESEAPARVGDLLENLRDADFERWIRARSALVAAFSEIADRARPQDPFHGLRSVRLACSSVRATGQLDACVWVLADATLRVNGETGRLHAHGRQFTCSIPVAGGVGGLLDALEAAGSAAWSAPLPGTSASFEDGVRSCLSRDENLPELPPPPSSGPNWELSHRLADEASETAWGQARAALEAGFDAICGDTFCEGDYPAIEPLDFECAVDAADLVSRCAWTFAQAAVLAIPEGGFTPSLATQTCEIEVGAPASELLAVLSAEAPLYAPLPGRTTSVYDALLGCL